MKKSTNSVENYTQPQLQIFATKLESVVCASTGNGTTETVVIGEEESW